MKFRKGLEDTIVNLVAMLKEGHPADDDLTTWIKVAKFIARQHLRNEVFNSAIRKDKLQMRLLMRFQL
jgi:hypothetical protein